MLHNVMLSGLVLTMALGIAGCQSTTRSQAIIVAALPPEASASPRSIDEFEGLSINQIFETPTGSEIKDLLWLDDGPRAGLWVATNGSLHHLDAEGEVVSESRLQNLQYMWYDNRLFATLDESEVFLLQPWGEYRKEVREHDSGFVLYRSDGTQAWKIRLGEKQNHGFLENFAEVIYDSDQDCLVIVNFQPNPDVLSTIELDGTIRERIEYEKRPKQLAVNWDEHHPGVIRSMLMRRRLPSKGFFSRSNYSVETVTVRGGDFEFHTVEEPLYPTSAWPLRSNADGADYIVRLVEKHGGGRYSYPKHRVIEQDDGTLELRDARDEPGGLDGMGPIIMLPDGRQVGFAKPVGSVQSGTVGLSTRGLSFLGFIDPDGCVIDHPVSGGTGQACNGRFAGDGAIAPKMGRTLSNEFFVSWGNRVYRVQADAP